MHKGGRGGAEVHKHQWQLYEEYGKYPKVVGLKAPIALPMVTNVGCK